MTSRLALVQKEEPPESTALTPHVGNGFLSNTEKLHAIETEVIRNLESQSEDEILEVRRRSKILGKTAWKIEVACDAQILSRAENMRKAPGWKRTWKGDVGGRGVTAAVRKRAKALGVTPNTIFKNAAIFRLIKSVESDNPDNTKSLGILDEKSYFHAALTAADPKTALLTFAEEKKVRKRFRVSDAYRYLEKHCLTRKAVTTKVVQSARAEISKLSRRNLEIQHVLDCISKTQANIKLCPSSEVNRIHQDYIDELRFYIEGDLFMEDLAVLLKRSISKGNKTSDQMSKDVGLPIDVVEREISLLATVSHLVRVPGTTPQEWSINIR